MTRFADQLFDDLMREHGTKLASARMPAAPKRRLTARPVLLTAGAGGLAAAAAVGTLVAAGGTPAYAVTANANGTVTLAVYQQSGIAQANAKLHDLGDRVVLVPVGTDCPSLDSLPAPAVPARDTRVQVSASATGTITANAHGVPAGDILVVGLLEPSGHFSSDGQPRAVLGTYKLTSPPAPSCVSLPALPAPPPHSGASGNHGGHWSAHSGSGQAAWSGKSTSSGH